MSSWAIPNRRHAFNNSNMTQLFRASYVSYEICMYLFHRERERELFGPKKRGPKPETFLLKVGEFNSDCHELVSPCFSHISFLTHHLCFPTIES